MEASLSVLSVKTLPVRVLECSNSRLEGGVGDSSYKQYRQNRCLGVKDNRVCVCVCVCEREQALHMFIIRTYVEETGEPGWLGAASLGERDPDTVFTAWVWPRLAGWLLETHSLGLSPPGLGTGTALLGLAEGGGRVPQITSTVVNRVRLCC